MSWALGYELDWDKMVQFAVEVNLRPDLGPDDEARLFHASLLDIQKQTGYTCGTTLCLRGQDLVHVFTLRTMSSPSPRRFAVTLKKVGPVEHFEKLLDVLGVTKPPMWFVVLTNNVDENMDRAPGLTIKELLHVVDKYMAGECEHLPWRLQQRVERRRAKKASLGLKNVYPRSNPHIQSEGPLASAK